jgi:predicted TIM-barrel fold metal-dependent hydrolase
MKAARQCFDQMPIDENDKKKIGYLNAERLLETSFDANKQLAQAV